MTKLANLAKMSVVSGPGTGAFDLDAAVSGFLTFADAGIVDGDVVSYGAREGANSETGTGTYTASGSTLSRTVLDSTNSGAAVNFGAGVEVFITPNAADLAQLDQAQTFTAAQGTTITGLTLSGSTIATDASLSNAFSITLTGNGTLSNPTNIVAGRTYVWIVTQDGTGSRTLNYGSYFKWPNKSIPTLTTDAGGIDVIAAFAKDTTTLLASIQQDYGTP